MFKRVTFTGIDDQTDLDRLYELQNKYPFEIEWGLLLSLGRQGKGRYPHILDFMCRLDQRIIDNKPKLRLSAHLCGELAKSMAKNFSEWGDIWPRLLLFFPRIQINLNNYESHITVDKFLENIKSDALLKWEFILQDKTCNKTFIDQVVEQQPKNLSILFDASGGNGISPKEWPEPRNIFCSYAGGLGADNLEAECDRIKAVVGERDFGIDMENKLRTNDVFDLNQVEKCLEIINAKLFLA